MRLTLLVPCGIIRGMRKPTHSTTTLNHPEYPDAFSAWAERQRKLPPASAPATTAGFQSAESQKPVSVFPALLTVNQAAAALGISPRTLRRLLAEGQLAHVRVGRLVRVSPLDLDAYITLNRSIVL